MSESDFDGEPFTQINVSDVDIAILDEIIAQIKKVHGVDISTLDQRHLQKLITKIFKKETSMRNRAIWWASVQVTQYTINSIVSMGSMVPVLKYISKCPHNWL